MKTWATLTIPTIALLFVFSAITRTPSSRINRTRFSQDHSESKRSDRRSARSLSYDDIKSLSDEGLVGRLHELVAFDDEVSSNHDYDEAPLDQCLSEMVRRGGDRFKLSIAAVVNQLDQRFGDALKARGRDPKRRHLPFDDEDVGDTPFDQGCDIVLVCVSAVLPGWGWPVRGVR